jgi:hypothetical protein
MIEATLLEKWEHARFTEPLRELAGEEPIHYVKKVCVVLKASLPPPVLIYMTEELQAWEPPVRLEFPFGRNDRNSLENCPWVIHYESCSKKERKIADLALFCFRKSENREESRFRYEHGGTVHFVFLDLRKALYLPFEKEPFHRGVERTKFWTIETPRGTFLVRLTSNYEVEITPVEIVNLNDTEAR